MWLWVVAPCTMFSFCHTNFFLVQILSRHLVKSVTDRWLRDTKKTHTHTHIASITEISQKYRLGFECVWVLLSLSKRLSLRKIKRWQNIQKQRRHNAFHAYVITYRHKFFSVLTSNEPNFKLSWHTHTYTQLHILTPFRNRHPSQKLF